MRQWIQWWVLVGGLVLPLVGCGNGRPARHVLPGPTQAAFEQGLPGAESTMVATGGNPSPGPTPSPGSGATATVAGDLHARVTPEGAGTRLPTSTNHVAPTPVPSPPPAAYTRLAGLGESQSDPFPLQPGPVLFQIRHPNASYFAAFVLNAAGDHLALLASAGVPISGTQFFGAEVAGDYHVHVIAEDAWDIAVMQPSSDAAFPVEVALGALQGDGPAVSPPLALVAGDLDLTWEHTGTYPFALMLWTAEGRLIGKVVHNGGVRAGTAHFDVPQPGTYLLNIQGDGPWSVTEGP